MTEQQTRAETFRALHTSDEPIVLVNAWDVASARIIEAAGARAVATTSAGVAWSLGAQDGDTLARTLAVDLVRRIVEAVAVPVTADIESGFGTTPDEVGETVRAVLDVGAVGVNIEDALHGGPPALRDVDEQCARLRAARSVAEDAGVPLYVNARVDTYLRGLGGLAETVARADAYLAAGADGIFVPGVVDPDLVAQLVARIPAPVNILAGPGAPPIPELAKLGVRRVSLGSSVAEAAYGVARRVAEESYDTGTYDSLAGGVDFGEVNALMGR
ncbi:2-methylisocitrate lyase-like PEP mutase family enzyme [Micromonospora pisi]|uniref:2-methylisocitrate lyase-like PEP mutase family enzyme n=1 Tax=Micromonospora pisi TaxID=589240 RepID=A0A495JIX9_9ACTN|nr:isocitrate lyase/phosphoenolpyruvate mutase family protein [Micromonospora pisi]RKR88986.1 2-methylisocitrate lyase-like PEP mutase family enzyme [Micromonospora pisi]